jgi:signal peptidase II
MVEYLKMKKHILTASLAVVFFGFDFFTKVLIEKHFRVGDRLDVIGSFVQFTKIYNEGGVFGILQGYKNLFLIVSLIVLVVLIVFYYLEKNKTYLFCISMGLIFSGAFGNIFDRLLGKKGVVDFIYVGVDNVYRWPAFNVADSCIVVGAFLLIIMFFLQGRKNQQAPVTDAGEPKH